LSKDQQPTFNIKKNIVYSFLIKGLSIFTSFLLVPLTVKYVNTVQYGIWLTIASLVSWINNFDIGLGNGLRNRIAASMAKNEQEGISRLISTTYILLFFIAASIFAVFFVVGSFFNWNSLLNISDSVGFNIWPVIVIATAFFCAQFVLQPINNILTAFHQPFKAALISLSGQIITLTATFVLTRYTTGTLFILVFVVSGAPVLTLGLSSLFLFLTKLRAFKPQLKAVDRSSAKSLLGLGTAFFFVQIGALVLYETDNIIITRTIGPAEVSTFNFAYKYFSILILAFNIIITPYWSAFTDAFARDDQQWIKAAVKKLRLIWLLMSAASVILYFGSGLFYRIWLGENVMIPASLSLSMAVYVVVQNWMLIHSYFLNGTGKLKIQLILVIGTGIVNVPLSVFLIKRAGVCGTVWANVIVMGFMSLIFTYQYRLLINKQATGIWNK